MYVYVQVYSIKKLMTNKCWMKVPTLSGGFMVSETNYAGL